MTADRSTKKMEPPKHEVPAKAAGRPAIVPPLDMAAVRAVKKRERLEAEAFELAQAEACETKALDPAAEQGGPFTIDIVAE